MTPSQIKVQSAIDLLRAYQESLSDTERVEMWEEITEGYCPECGVCTDGRQCHCTNDE